MLREIKGTLAGARSFPRAPVGIEFSKKGADRRRPLRASPIFWNQAVVLCTTSYAHDEQINDRRQAALGGGQISRIVLIRL
jgi:hypothetical protein